MEWEILLTPEVEAFLDELYESDQVSHQLVNQASWFWNATAQPKAAHWWTRSPRPGSPT